ncbi:MAG: RecX family transcriptional regulator [candidate division WOR-3 bacterium]|nr:MAG: RecX family transcriptional regulator [candidate division WOR-3 bacterium]
MKISKIEPQKKNKKRSTIYIDGKFAFGISTELLIKFDLHEGDELDNDLIQNVLLAKEKQRIRNRAFRLLHYRNRAIKELKDRLLKIGFDQSLVEEVIDEMVQDRTLDDENFTEAFIADYTKLRTKGNIFIRRELTRKGVASDVIERVIRNRDEKGIVAEYLRAKLSHLDISQPKDRQKVLRRLLTRGFTPSVVYDALNDYEK